MSNFPPQAAAAAAAPVSRRRFWLTVLCIALLNAAAWIGYDRYVLNARRGTLRVDAFEPGDGAAVGARPNLRWHFSADVIPTALYGHDPAHITPNIAGRWTWDDPRTLVFTPDVDLPRATRVRFALDQQFIRSGTGATLKEPYVAAVDAQPLELLDAKQAAMQDRDQYIIELRFNDRVAPGDVLQHLTMITAAGRKVGAQLHGEAAGNIVRIRTDSVEPDRPDADTELHVHLSRGVVGLSGPLAIDREIDQTVTLARALAATDLKAFVPARGQPNLLLRFNNDVDAIALKEVIALDPATPYTIESYGGQSVKLLGDFRPGTRYTLKLNAAPAGADRNKYPRPGQLVAFMPDRGSGVWFDNEQGYLSTAGNRALLVHAVNVDALHVALTRMYDNNLVAWRNSTQRDRWVDADNFSRPLAERTIKLAAQKNVQQDVRLSLDELLPADAPRDGVYRVAVDPVRKDHDDAASSEDEDEYRYIRRDAAAVVTLSDIGLTAKQTRDGMVAWATSLRTAQPLANVRVRLFSNKNQPLGSATTNAEGIATITGVHIAKDETAAIVLADAAPISSVAPLGPDASPTTKPSVATQLTWLDLTSAKWELGDTDTSGRPYLRSGYEAFVYTDRGVYRPGETVHLRAIVRGPDQLAPRTTFPLRWQLRRPDQRDWKNYTVMLNADGAAALDVPMPADLPTGQWSVTIGLPDEIGPNAKTFGSADFQIEEFLPNRLKSTLSFTNVTGDRFAIGDTNLTTAVQGDYLFGRPAAGLALELTTHVDRVPFHPTGWPGWTFGDDANVLTQSAQPAHDKRKHAKKPQSTEPESATLDQAGHFAWSIDAATLTTNTDGYHGPWQLTASAGVREPGGRAVSATKQIDLDALPAYIGVHRATLSAAQPGQPCETEVAIVKPDGAAARGETKSLDAQLFRASWNTVLTYRDGRYHYNSTRVLDEVQRASVPIDDTGRGVWSPKVPDSGEYVLCFRDPASGAASSISFEATDGSPWNDNVSRENPEHIDVRVLPPSPGTPGEGRGEGDLERRAAPDEQNHPHPNPLPEYRARGPEVASVGDTVNVLIASPFAGRLLLSVETDNVVQTTTLDMQASHVIVPVKVTDACRPNAFISATVIRPIDPDAKWRTHRAFGVTRLNVDPSDQRLNIVLTAPAELRPLQSLDVGVTVTDNAGQPVPNAAVTVAAVDEGICSLTNFATPDPLGFFTARRALSVDSSDVFGLLMPEVPRPDKASSTGGDGSDPSPARHHSPVVARRVKSVALAWSEIHTDENGSARASFPVPEFQGKLRVMAVGYANAAFGSAGRGVTVRSPILAQTTWPRFAAPGDRFNVPVVLFNNTATGGDVHLTLDPSDLLKFGDLPRVHLDAGAQKQIELPVTVAQSVGVAKIHLHAAMNDDATFDESIELPIRPAAPSLQYGGYAAATVNEPAKIRDGPFLLSGTDALQVAVTPWPTLQIPAGLDYLDRYPYGCVEQTTSACLPLIALGDIGKTIDPVHFDPQRMKLKIDIGITHLIGMQTADGGLAMWTGERTPWPWGSVYAAHFLTEARAAGYEVPDDFYRHLLSYVRHLLDTGSDDATQLETQAYAAYVLAAAGKVERPILSRLTELASASPRVDDPSDGYAMRSDARLMLSCAWLHAGRRDLAEGLIPQTLPTPRAHRQADGNIGSPIRDRALLIQTLLAVQPENPALPDLVQQLADSGVHREWASTHDTALAVLAIGRYLRESKKHEPYDTAQLALGEQVLASTSEGGSIAWNAPPAFDTSTAPLMVKINGAADSTAHVSWLKTGVPLTPPADAEHGMKIRRRYLSLNGEELHGSVRSGDLVRVELTLEAPPQQAGIVIEDMLPAGLEVENPRLETSAKDRAKDDRPNDVPSFGDDRLDVSDDRVVIVGSMPSAWKARGTYLARAVTPGVYTVPPVRAEQMYDINVNALSGAGGTLTVTSATSNVASVHDDAAP